MTPEEVTRALAAYAITLEQVRDILGYIAKIADDDESAHSLEDALRDAVLRAVARGASDAKELAALVLTSAEIQFARWCA